MLNLKGILLALLIVGVIGFGIWAVNQPGLRTKLLGWLLALGGVAVAGRVIWRVLHPG